MGRNQLRIEICGGIATGKTSLAALFENKGARVIYERPEDNPYLTGFYSSKGTDNAFETEAVFTLLHYSQIMSNVGADCLRVSDFSPFQDYCYGLSNLVEEDLNQYLSLYRFLRGKMGKPDLMILTKCSLPCQMERIRLRGRAAEQGVADTYVAQINDILERHVNAEVPADSLLIVDTEKNDISGNFGDALFNRIAGLAGLSM